VKERFVIQRACRISNKDLHEKHPEWFDPTRIRQDDASDLLELMNARQEPFPQHKKLESFAMAGVDFFLIRDQHNRKKSLHGKIAALVTYGVIHTFHGRVGVVTDTYLDPSDLHIATYVQSYIERFFASIAVRYMPSTPLPERVPRPPKTDYSGIELSERCDTAYAQQDFVPLHPPGERITRDLLPPNRSTSLSASGRIKC